MNTENNYVKSWKWFYHQNKQAKSFILLGISVLCYVVGFLSYQSLPENPAPQYTKIEEYYSIISTLGLLAGIILSHLACIIFQPGREK